MPQTYHQLNAEQSEAGSLLRFGLKSILVLTFIAMGFLFVVSVRPGNGAPTDGELAHAPMGSQGAISVTAFDLGFEPEPVRP